jgi:hypothetical protein
MADIRALLERLRTFGAYTMYDDGSISDYEPNQLTTQAHQTISELWSIASQLANYVTHQSHCWADHKPPLLCECDLADVLARWQQWSELADVLSQHD